MIDLDTLDDPAMREQLQEALETAMEPLDAAYLTALDAVLAECAAAGLDDEATLPYREELAEEVRIKRVAIAGQVFRQFLRGDLKLPVKLRTPVRLLNRAKIIPLPREVH